MDTAIDIVPLIPFNEFGRFWELEFPDFFQLETQPLETQHPPDLLIGISPHMSNTCNSHVLLCMLNAC